MQFCRHLQRSAILFATMGFMLGCGALHAAEPSSAFISGFERFARHGDLSAEDAGTLLVSELSCVACHASSESRFAPKRGPALHGVANHLQQTWLRSYLLNPTEMKPGTTMPDMLKGLPYAEREQAVDALVAFLGSQQQPFVTVKGTGAVPVIHEFWNHGDPNRGQDLYHTIGCVACHDPDKDYDTVESAPSAVDQMIEQLDPEELAELGLARAARSVASVPHSDNLGSKYTRRSLTMFLLDPAKTRDGKRMPSLRLTPSEAADLAAHLMRHRKSSTVSHEAPSAALIAQGRKLFREQGCLSCHEVSGLGLDRSPQTEGDSETTISTLGVAKPLVALDPDAELSCLGNASRSMPRYELDLQQIDMIRSVLGSLDESKTVGPADEVHLKMLQYNCYACHERDTWVEQSGKLETLGGVGRNRKSYFETVGHVDLGDEGRLPPSLTGVGRKLLPKTLASVFVSKTPPYRPYMKARMPAYHTDDIHTIVEQLPLADEASDASENSVFGITDGSNATVGQELVGTGCVECHSFGGEALPGVVGVDLDGITARVRPQWFFDFVLNPGAVKNRTRMPTFFPDGKSHRQDLLDGRVKDQIASIWVYLKDLANQPLPEKIAAARARNYELSPSDRPIVLRTFMKQAGTHAIAVGFPSGVHYAFDSETVRLAIGWKGRFLDARGTWFERFTPPADPLTEREVLFPSGIPFRIAKDVSLDEATALPSEPPYRFDGYRLDEEGIPTMLYRMGDVGLEDRIEGLSNRRLRRTWKILAGDDGIRLSWMAHATKDLKLIDRRTAIGDGLTVQIIAPTNLSGDVRQVDSMKRWMISLPAKEEQEIAVEYSW